MVGRGRRICIETQEGGTGDGGGGPGRPGARAAPTEAGESTVFSAAQS